MIRLKDLLFESKASQEAKRLGLTHTSFGRYADASGKIVAFTRNGKLVHVKGTKSDAKKSHARKEEISQKVQSVIDKISENYPERIEGYKKNGVFEYMTESIVEGEEVEIFDQTVTVYGTFDSYQQKLDAQPEQREAIKRYQELSGYYAYDDDVSAPQILAAQRASYQQHKRFLAKMRPGKIAQLFVIADEWQGVNSGYRFREEFPEKAVARSRFLNDLIKGKYTNGVVAKVDVPQGEMVRGMTLSYNEDDIDGFFENFIIGETVTFPPAGWSLHPDKAKSFASINDDVIAVQLKIKGKSVTGVALSAKGKWAKDRKISDSDLYKTMTGKDIQQTNSMIAGTYGAERSIQNALAGAVTTYLDRECEVITPGWMQYKVTGTKKTVWPGQSSQAKGADGVYIVYEIELEEVGPTDDPDLIRESKIKKVSKSALKTLYKFMYGSFTNKKLKK